jgi:hypothetical protein
MADKKEQVISLAYFDAEGNKVSAKDPKAVSGEEVVKLPDGTELRRYLIKPQK